MRGKINLTTITRVYSLVDPSGELRKELLNGADPLLLVKKYRCFIIEEFEKLGNTILDEGANFIFRAITGLNPTPFFDGQNTYIGVGDSDAPPDKSQTGLLGTNTFYKKVSEGYPIIENNSLLFATWFDYSEANFYWREWTIANGPSNEAVNLNRAVEDLGEKTPIMTRIMTVWLTTP